jgi:hypothetical protein
VLETRGEVHTPPVEGEASKQRLIYLFGKPASVFQAVWRGLEAEDSSGRILERLNILRTAEGEASIEIEGVSASQALTLARRMRGIEGVSVLLTDAEGEDLYYTSTGP